ncbi:MAG: methyltransferase domain-containing protein [Proteobacteria bacterium]|nr:methyltransferase domain-containing protein [Pseudomonadota bacterium]MBU4471170.1 methyltransferase domain-containing protein [Pseudomonadota bacterium]MCG2753145.1 methyltransferase domain-containing protein [Desulfobacteraceae bacterium]
MSIVLSILAVIVLALLVIVIWRFSSRRHTLPCPVWLAWLVEMDNPFTRINRAAVIVDNLGIETGMVVLDFGCGPGRLTVPIARLVGDQGEVTAVDIQPGMLKLAREKAQAENLTNIRFIQTGINEGKLDRNRFDRALLVTVLGEIPNREEALTEIYFALKPGGILSITELIFDPHFQSRKTVIRLADAAGFQEKAFFGNRIAFTLHFEKPHDGRT